MAEDGEDRHQLSSLDVAGRRAVCGVCGPVGVDDKGGGRWRCSVRRQELARVRTAGVRKPPRGGPSQHPLSGLDVSAGQAVCGVCGPVRPAPQGKGWMCPVWQAELFPHASARRSEPPTGLGPREDYCRTCNAVSSKYSLDRLAGEPICVPCAKRWAAAVDRNDPVIAAIDLSPGDDVPASNDRLDWLAV